MQENTLIKRIIILCALVAVFISVTAVGLAELQIVKGQQYRQTSGRTITRTEQVEAARGEIYDRYGRPLITNRTSYNIVLDPSLMPSEEKNSILLSLINICSAHGTRHADTLPVGNLPPYELESEMTSQQSSRLSRYIKNKGLHEDISGEELFEFLRKLYKVPEDFTPYDARQVVGVRWELELRALFGISQYIFCTDIDKELLTLVSEQSLPGVRIETVTDRVYHTQYAAHILGYVGPIYESEYQKLKDQGYSLDDTLGKAGAEAAFESYLRGTDGSVVYEMTGDGKITDTYYTSRPMAGNDVYLTLDIELQGVLERALERTVLALREADDPDRGGGEAEGASAAVINVKTGEVLAMGSYPTYSLETFSRDYSALLNDPLTPLVNRAIAGTYPPGSTFKMITAIAALENGVVNSRTRIYDHGIYTFYKDYQPACSLYRSTGGSHGSLTVAEALKVSCNYFFYDVGRQTGINEIARYAAMFGLGQTTGIEIAGERAGSLASVEYRSSQGKVWVPGDTLQAAIGQSDNTFTPLQIANYIATLVNGGINYETTLLRSVAAHDGSYALYEASPTERGRIDVSDASINAVLDGMYMATQRGGTASSLFSSYPVKTGAKTGSAQSSRLGVDNSVFVTFAPFDDPEIAMCVIIEYGGQGGNSAQIAVDVYDAYFGSAQYGSQQGGEGVLQR